ncbi:MAG: 2Fe-2S iron-sulfur cluster binding domain-containing protein [Burkholderiales bacterium]|nr:2Fe-2S iron-sulfur cluster binding domain-containing protein [Burkholderiales bacterium]
MQQRLSLSRAARLVGVTRGTLQQKIQTGELRSFDGMVSVGDLMALFPELRLESDIGFERVAKIREESFGKRLRERLLPSQEILAQRVFEQSRELVDLRAHLQRYHAMVVRLREHLHEQEMRAAGASPAPAAAAQELGAILDRELEAVLGGTDVPNPLAVMDDMLRVMSAHVVIHPSRHEFFVDGADTILDAALRSGLAVNYGCSNGNCGLCKARVVSGQVQKVRHQDYVLSEAEKRQGYTLLCSNTAVGDLVIEALESTVPGDIPEQQIVARVKAVQALGDDLALLHLQTPRTNRLRFLAGQNLTLTAGEASAQLPIASCPCDDRNLQFHVSRDAQDGFAQQVFGSLKAGEAVTLFGPWGDFVLRADSVRSIIFIACDTGFAPVKSLLEHAMALELSERLYLYWLATPRTGHYLANLCRSWADALDNFTYVPVAAEHGDALELMRAIGAGHPDLNGFDIYVAGPEAFVDSATATLLERGFPQTQLTAAIV